jgi:hypothetical protein
MTKKKENKEKETVEVVEVVNSEIKVDVKDVKKTVKSLKIQLAITTPFFYDKVNEGAKLVVENLGFGDVYVSEEFKTSSDKDSLIATGESKEFDCETLYFLSYSQPFVLLKEVI